LTSQASAEEQNKRVLQAVAYLIEWAKHIVTAGAALMVLGATLLKDLAKDLSPTLSIALAVALGCFYLSMLVSVTLALRLVRQCANVVLTTQPQIGGGTELATLKSHLTKTQVAFGVGLTAFSIAALTIIVSWGAKRDLPAAVPPAPALSCCVAPLAAPTGSSVKPHAATTP
jgi:hypothetical protein